MAKISFRKGSLRALVAGLAISILTTGTASAQISDRRSEATRLRSDIERQGAKLSTAAEEFNLARIEQARADKRLSESQRQVGAAQTRWERLKAEFSQQVRIVYMHPGLWAKPFVEARNINQLGRIRVLSATVLMKHQTLLRQTERARAELEAQRHKEIGLRQVAASKIAKLGAAKDDAERLLANQKVLLGRVSGEIADADAAEQRRLAQRIATSQPVRSAAPSPSPPVALAGAASPKPSPKTDPNERQSRAAPVRSSAGKAVATAAAQMGKPYEYGAAGPDRFDCSGLTQYAWAAAGVSLPHSSQAQFSSLPHIDRDELQPGDLVFFGSPIHHVGIYEGNGVMINAPQTGDSVKRSSINRGDYAGAARP